MTSPTASASSKRFRPSNCGSHLTQFSDPKGIGQHRVRVDSPAFAARKHDHSSVSIESHGTLSQVPKDTIGASIYSQKFELASTFRLPSTLSLSPLFRILLRCIHGRSHFALVRLRLGSVSRIIHGVIILLFSRPYIRVCLYEDTPTVDPNDHQSVLKSRIRLWVTPLLPFHLHLPSL